MSKDQITVTLPIKDYEELVSKAEGDDDMTYKQFAIVIAKVLANGGMMLAPPTFNTLLQHLEREHPKSAARIRKDFQIK